MNTSDSDGFNNPFARLKDMLKAGSVKASPKEPVTKKAPLTIPKTPEKDDQMLFSAAMAGVQALKCKTRHVEEDSVPKQNDSDDNAEDAEAVNQLNQLVETGKGFIVSATPEYIEGIGHNAPALMARRLHQGVFSIQKFIDLHGFTVATAETALDEFMASTIRENLRMVLIVHGRGLSSPGKPRLKSFVTGWLKTGPWRKWIIAFTSARACDGGTGATYVLLRNRPVTRRFRKKKGVIN